MHRDAGIRWEIEPIGPSSFPSPAVLPVQLSGLIQYVHTHGPQFDFLDVADELQIEFGHMQEVVRAATMLEFVSTNRDKVTLTKKGQLLAGASVSEHAPILQAHLLPLPMFAGIAALLAHKKGVAMTRIEVIDRLRSFVPPENLDHAFESLVEWGRRARLFVFDLKSQKLARASTAV